MRGNRNHADKEKEVGWKLQHHLCEQHPQGVRVALYTGDEAPGVLFVVKGQIVAQEMREELFLQAIHCALCRDLRANSAGVIQEHIEQKHPKEEDSNPNQAGLVTLGNLHIDGVRHEQRAQQVQRRRDEEAELADGH